MADYVLGTRTPGERTAIVDFSSGVQRRWTYHELRSAVSALSATLRSAGVSEGDVVAVLTENSAEFVIAYFGVLAAGGLVLPLPPLATVPVWTDELEEHGAQALIVDTSLWHQPPKSIAVTICIGQTSPTGTVQWERTTSLVPATDQTPALGGERPAVLLSSSGTSGRPTTTVLTHHNLVAGLAQIDAVHRLREGEVVTCVGPLRHIYGMQMALNPVLRAGGTLLIGQSRFCATDYVQLLRDQHVGVAYLVPSVIGELAALREHPRLPALRLIVSGGAPLAPAAADRCARAFGRPVVQGFGMTEAGCVSFPPDDRITPAGSVGIVLPGTDARFADPASGEDVPAGTVGELLLRSPQVSPDCLDASGDGWFRTGDLAVLDQEGFLHVVGRLKSLIKYKGHQVSPAELEKILIAHPAVVDVFVVGEPDPVAGELPKAFVVAPLDLPLGVLAAHVAERVAPYEKIRLIQRVREIPRSATGKASKPEPLRVLLLSSQRGELVLRRFGLDREEFETAVVDPDHADALAAIKDRWVGVDVVVYATPFPRTEALVRRLVQETLGAGGRLIGVLGHDWEPADAESHHCAVARLAAEVRSSDVVVVTVDAGVKHVATLLPAVVTGAADHLSGGLVRPEDVDSGLLRPVIPLPPPIRYPFNSRTSLTVSAEYDRIRAEPSLTQVQLPFGAPAWLVADHDQARFVLSDPRFSRAAAKGRDIPRQSESVNEAGLLSLDPPDHTRLRSLISGALTMRRAEQQRHGVRTLCEELTGSLIDAGPPADLVEQYALPVSFGVISGLLGVPAQDRRQIREWSDAHLSTTVLPPEEVVRRNARLKDYFAGLIDERQLQPGDDLLSDLLRARDHEQRLSTDELVQLAANLVFAGYEATSTQIPNFILFLLERPALWDELCDRPDRVSAAVDELLRFVPLMAGAGTMPRYALEDVVIGETLVRAGDPVIVSLGASNRDASVFPAPHSFDLDRPRNRGHLAFGHGAHHCVGMSLARVELQEALAAVLRNLPQLRLAGEPRWKDQVMRGPRSMPVTW
ncbi:cytochrome P450 [Lentzea sp. E54]|uniref:cytochrome P450 n=1 Tax=Lentzea xerophila TaxID=3435883 RepID=UPI003DA405D9